MNIIYNPVSLALFAGAFVLIGAVFGAWLGAAISNSGARNREARRENAENEAARLLIFAALRVMQLDVHFVHDVGVYSEEWALMWSRHYISLERALARPLSARALDSVLFNRFVECLVRVEILHGFLQSEVGKKLDNAERAGAAHIVYVQIRELLDSLSFEYRKDQAILGFMQLESTYCKECGELNAPWKR